MPAIFALLLWSLPLDRPKAMIAAQAALMTSALSATAWRPWLVLSDQIPLSPDVCANVSKY